MSPLDSAPTSDELMSMESLKALVAANAVAVARLCAKLGVPFDAPRESTPPPTTPVAEPTSATIIEAAHGAVTAVPGVDVALTPATPAACSTKCRDDLTKVQGAAQTPAMPQLTGVVMPMSGLPVTHKIQHKEGAEERPMPWPFFVSYCQEMISMQLQKPPQGIPLKLVIADMPEVLGCHVSTSALPICSYGPKIYSQFNCWFSGCLKMMAQCLALLPALYPLWRPPDRETHLHLWKICFVKFALVSGNYVAEFWVQPSGAFNWMCLLGFINGILDSRTFFLRIQVAANGVCWSFIWDPGSKQDLTMATRSGSNSTTINGTEFFAAYLELSWDPGDHEMCRFFPILASPITLQAIQNYEERGEQWDPGIHLQLEKLCPRPCYEVVAQPKILWHLYVHIVIASGGIELRLSPWPSGRCGLNGAPSESATKVYPCATPSGPDRGMYPMLGAEFASIGLLGESIPETVRCLIVDHLGEMAGANDRLVCSFVSHTITASCQMIHHAWNMVEGTNSWPGKLLLLEIVVGVHINWRWHLLEDGGAPCQSGRYELASVHTSLVNVIDIILTLPWDPGVHGLLATEIFMVVYFDQSGTISNNLSFPARREWYEGQSLLGHYGLIIIVTPPGEIIFWSKECISCLGLMAINLLWQQYLFIILSKMSWDPAIFTPISTRLFAAGNLTLITIHEEAVFITISSPFLEVNYMIQDGKELKLVLELPYKAYSSTVPMMCSWPSLTLVKAAVNEIVVMTLLPAAPILPSTETAHKKCTRSWATMLQPVISGAQLQNGDIVKRMLLRIHEMAEHFICSDGNIRKVWGVHLLLPWPLRQGFSAIDGLRASRFSRGEECHDPALYDGPWAARWPVGSQPIYSRSQRPGEHGWMN